MSPSPPPHFHRRYTRPIRGIVLQSCEGVCFHFDLFLLAQHSSFFCDLADLPSPSSSLGEPIELSNTNSTALVLVLELIRGVEQGVAAPALALSHAEPFTPSLVDNILEFADMYDMPLARELLKYRSNPYTCYIVNVISGDAAAVGTIINHLVCRSAECLLYDADWLDVIRNRCPEGYALLSGALWLWDVAFYTFKVEQLWELTPVKTDSALQLEALVPVKNQEMDWRRTTVKNEETNDVVHCTCAPTTHIFKLQRWPRQYHSTDNGEEEIAATFITFPAKIWTTAGCALCRRTFRNYAGILIERHGARLVLSLKRRYFNFERLEPYWDAIVTQYKTFGLDVSTHDERHPLVVCRFK